MSLHLLSGGVCPQPARTMARPKSIDDEEILEAAREVFFEEGIQATTAEIARRAGISEGTIYRRYSTKNDLFVAAMDIPSPPEWVSTLEAIEAEDDLREGLYRVSLEIIEFFEEIIPKVNMVMSNLADEQMFGRGDGAPPLRALKTVMQFIERERERGRIGRCDPELVARMYLGSLFHFAFAQVSGMNEILPMPRQTYARGVVKYLLDGLHPAEPTEGAVDVPPG